VLPLLPDVRGQWPKRLWCRHTHSVDRKFYWTCFDCHEVRFKRDAIMDHNAMMARLDAEMGKLGFCGETKEQPCPSTEL
jgi:hypothetical protein